MANRRWRTFLYPRPLNPWPWNPNQSWPDCGKHLCTFWFKSLQWSRIYWVHKISMATAGWPWPLTPWSPQFAQCDVDLLMIYYDQFHRDLHSFRRCEGEKRTHTSDTRTDNLTSQCLQRLIGSGGIEIRMFAAHHVRARKVVVLCKFFFYFTVVFLETGKMVYSHPTPKSWGFRTPER